MLESITIHTFFEAIGINVVVCLVLYPILATIWDVSAARYRRELAAKVTAKETK